MDADGPCKPTNYSRTLKFKRHLTSDLSLKKTDVPYTDVVNFNKLKTKPMKIGVLNYSITKKKLIVYSVDCTYTNSFKTTSMIINTLTLVMPFAY